MSSIRRWLLAALLGALLTAGLTASIATYMSARAEVDVLLDEELRQIALSLRDHATLDLVRLERSGTEADERVLVEIWDPAFERPFTSRITKPLPRTFLEGHVNIVQDGREWRVYTALSPRQTIQVAQPTALRRALAASAAGRILTPVLLLMPVLLLVGWWIVGRGLRPLAHIAASLQRRSPTSLEPIVESGLPSELKPLADALNGLLARLDQSFEAQRRFAADAAHELRTPLTALGLQIQLAERATSPDDRERAFDRLREGMQRATRLVQQMLTMARIEPDAAEQPFGSVALADVATGVVEDLLPLARQHQIELSANCEGADLIAGNEDGVRLLIMNLVDNAIRYTSPGGRVAVTLRTEAHEVVLNVADNGPGIPEDERERVFDRFYRGRDVAAPGSGLGLAIAQQVATMHRATIQLGAGLDTKGLGVSVRFPTLQQGNASI